MPTCLECGNVEGVVPERCRNRHYGCRVIPYKSNFMISISKCDTSRYRELQYLECRQFVRHRSMSKVFEFNGGLKLKLFISKIWRPGNSFANRLISDYCVIWKEEFPSFCDIFCWYWIYVFLGVLPTLIMSTGDGGELRRNWYTFTLMKLQVNEKEVFYWGDAVWILWQICLVLNQCFYIPINKIFFSCVSVVNQVNCWFQFIPMSIQFALAKVQRIIFFFSRWEVAKCELFFESWENKWANPALLLVTMFCLFHNMNNIIHPICWGICTILSHIIGWFFTSNSCFQFLDGSQRRLQKRIEPHLQYKCTRQTGPGNNWTYNSCLWLYNWEILEGRA